MLHWIRRHPYLTITAVYVLSRLALCALGLTFDMRPLIYFDQTLDPVLLRDRLLESLWYCHTQPPAMNFAIGVMLKLFGPSPLAFYLWNCLLGLCGACALYALMRRMRVGAGSSLVLVLLFFVGPAAIVTEQQVFYDYPMMVVMCVAGLLLHRFASNRTWRDGFLFFGSLAVVALTRSLYHPIWLVGVIVVLVIADRKGWKRTVVTSLPALLAVVGWYLKNLVLFGGFFGSSWMGANLHSPTISKVPYNERLAMIARGELSPVSSTDDPFLSLDSFQVLGHKLRAVNTGIPVLDMQRRSTGAPNYNNPNYIDIHKALEADAKKILAERPALFLRSLAAALVIYCTPASEVWPFDVNRIKILPYDCIYNKVVFAQLNYHPGRIMRDYTATPEFEPRSTTAVIYNVFHAGILLMILIPLLTVLCLVWWWRATRRGETVDAAIYGYMIVTLAVTGLIGNLLSVAENNRYRFVVDPYYLLLAGVAWERWRARRRAGRSSPTVSETI